MCWDKTIHVFFSGVVAFALNQLLPYAQPYLVRGVNNVVTCFNKAAWYGFTTYANAATFVTEWRTQGQVPQESSVSFIKNGAVVIKHSMYMNQIHHHDMPWHLADDKNKIDFDFILYYFPRAQLNGKYEADVRILEDWLPLPAVQVVDLTLLAVQIIFNDTADDVIKLNFCKDNYCVQGNVLFSRKFMQWYLKEKHSRKLLDSDTFVVSFINKNMDVVTLRQESILILDDNYVIIPDATTE